MNFGKDSGTRMLRVDASGSNCAWSASESLSWLSIKPRVSGTTGQVTGGGESGMPRNFDVECSATRVFPDAPASLFD